MSVFDRPADTHIVYVPYLEHATYTLHMRNYSYWSFELNMKGEKKIIQFIQF